jgi:hypothetical protein
MGEKFHGGVLHDFYTLLPSYASMHCITVLPSAIILLICIACHLFMPT